MIKMLKQVQHDVSGGVHEDLDADPPKKADSMTIHMNIVLLASACLVWTQAPCLTGLFKTR